MAPPGMLVYPTINTGGDCAAMVSLWLRNALIDGSSLVSANGIGTVDQVRNLQNSYMSAPSYNSTQNDNQHGLWRHVGLMSMAKVAEGPIYLSYFERFLRTFDNYERLAFYIAFYSPGHGHAVGVFAAGNGNVYYLDPNYGCYKMTWHEARHDLPSYLSSHFSRRYTSFKAFDLFRSDDQAALNSSPARRRGDHWGRR